MSKYSFNGNWKFSLTLNTFNAVATAYATPYRPKGKLKEGFQFPISILDHHQPQNYPFQEQINAVNFLIENEKAIIQSVYEGLFIQYSTYKKKEKQQLEKENEPDYNEDDDDDFFNISEIEVPILTSPEEIKDHITIFCISIHPLHKDGLAYFKITANAWWEDIEFDFYMHGTRFLGNGDDTDYSIDTIFDDLGIDAETGNKLLNQRTSEGLVFHFPNKDNTPLREWQIQENTFYFMNLVNRNDTTSFLQEYQKGPEVYGKYWEDPRNVLLHACAANNEEIFYYILNNYNVEYNITIGPCIYHLNKKLAEELLSRGSSIAYAQGIQKIFERMADLDKTNADDAQWSKAFTIMKWVYSLGSRPLTLAHRNGNFFLENEFSPLGGLSEHRILEIHHAMIRLQRKHKSTDGIAIPKHDGAENAFKMHKAQLLVDVIERTKHPMTYWSLSLRKFIIEYIIADGAVSVDMIPRIDTEDNYEIMTFVQECISKETTKQKMKATMMNNETSHTNDTEPQNFNDQSAISSSTNKPNLIIRFMKLLRGGH